MVTKRKCIPPRMNQISTQIKHGFTYKYADKKNKCKKVAKIYMKLTEKTH